MLPIPPIPQVLSERRDWTVPSPEWEAWARATFVEGDGALHDELHAHLGEFRVGFLLTNCSDESGGTWTYATGGPLRTTVLRRNRRCGP